MWRRGQCGGASCVMETHAGWVCAWRGIVDCSEPVRAWVWGSGVGGGRSGRHGRAGRNNHIITPHTFRGAGVPAVLSDGRDVGGPRTSLTVGIKIWFQNRRSKYKKLMKAAQTGSGPSTPMGAPITPGSPLAGSPLEGSSPLGQPLPSSTPQSISPTPPAAQSPPSSHPYTSMAAGSTPHGASSQGPSPSGSSQQQQQQGPSSQTPSQQSSQQQQSSHSSSSQAATPVGEHLPPSLPSSLPPSASSPGLAGHPWGDMKPPVTMPYMYSWYNADNQHNLLT
ncbi:hypothetical protein E2C01_027179 [Portunus trituberculatus]|uniref:Homeobox domain-containing protein n=1 Tax=Portunus trituberculatus TaxID=210409 RepID=A0A5B7EL96_PORTR|nr:hypothetical protein [Portunus trituberculatus]